MKTIWPPSYHHNSFLATHALAHTIYGYTSLVPMNQCMLNKLSKEHNHIIYIHTYIYTYYIYTYTYMYTFVYVIHNIYVYIIYNIYTYIHTKNVTLLQSRKKKTYTLNQTHFKRSITKWIFFHLKWTHLRQWFGIRYKISHA